MKVVILLISFFGLFANAIGQKSPVLLTFSGTQLNEHVVMDSIIIQNLSQHCDTVLYAPDTVLNLLSVGVDEPKPNSAGFWLFQNSPNPFADQTSIKIAIPETGELILSVTDLLGREVAGFKQIVEPGVLKFSFIPGSFNIYLVTARWAKERMSIKLISVAQNTDDQCTLSYNGLQETQSFSKQPKSGNMFLCSLGDVFRIIGYKDSTVAILKTSLNTNMNYRLSFGLFPPCPGFEEIDYLGTEYYTVKIGSQCWMRENLDVGVMVNSFNTGSSHTECANNGVIEKYCYDNNPVNCLLYGGFYDWDEMMQYQSAPGTQGICPAGFHLPTIDEWSGLISYFGGEWEAGGKLKEEGIGNWLYPNSNATNESGFTAIPSGLRTNNGSFLSQNYYSYFWSSTENGSSNSWNRYIYYNNAMVYQSYDTKKYGYSVRCIMD